MNLKASAVALLALALCACNTNEKATPVSSWEGGAKFERGTVTAVADIGEPMKDKQVQIEGTVHGVCQGRGCWVEVDDGKGRMIAKSLDESVLFPKDCVGKKVLVMGIVRYKPAAACGEGSEGSDSGGHECPKPEILVEIKGAKLLP